ncbi:MAG: iron-sulfur cluster assembly scaffold protein [Acidobacteriota bacterium]
MSALYSEVILDHFRNPRNCGSLVAADISQEYVNPLCGDRIRVEVQLRGSVIEEARFRGDGCAISIAAASVLTELIVGASIARDEVISSEELLSSLRSEIKPSRLKCALLALEALRSGIEIYKSGDR